MQRDLSIVLLGFGGDKFFLIVITPQASSAHRNHSRATRGFIPGTMTISRTERERKRGQYATSRRAKDHRVTCQ